MKLLLIPAIACLLAVAAPVQAQKLLPPTYQAGKEYRFTQNQEMTMDMSALAKAAGPEAAGMLGKTTNNSVFNMSAKCEAGPGAGERTVTTSIDKVKIDMNAMGMQMSYDSSQPGSEKTLLGQQMGAIAGKKFIIVLDENDEVVRVEGLEDAQMFSQEQILQMMNPAMQLGIPKEGVSQGEEWKNKVEVPMGQLGKMEAEFAMKYSSDREVDGANCAVVEYTGTISGEITTGGAESGMPPMSMKSSEIKGNLSIDKNLRFPRAAENTTTMTLQMGNPTNPSESASVPASMKQTFKLDSVTDL